jgi:hypothetical protein
MSEWRGPEPGCLGGCYLKLLLCSFKKIRQTETKQNKNQAGIIPED